MNAIIAKTPEKCNTGEYKVDFGCNQVNLDLFIMWKNWVIGVLGSWIILLAFIIPPGSTQRALMLITGLVIALMGFLNIASFREIDESHEPPQPPVI